MQIVKGRKKKVVDVYTVDGVDFLTRQEALEYVKSQKLKEGQSLYSISYSPEITKKGVVFNKRLFISIKKSDYIDEKASLIVALSELAEKHKNILKPKIFKKSKEDKNPTISHGFFISPVIFKDSAEYDKITQQAYTINGKNQSVKLYKTNEFGNVLNSKKGK